MKLFIDCSRMFNSGWNSSQSVTIKPSIFCMIEPRKELKLLTNMLQNVLRPLVTIFRIGLEILSLKGFSRLV
jgi:hypothetical protein